MTLQQLRYVVALDNYRHFVTAADSCFVSQSTLSIQLKKLEDEIGLALFERNVQPMKPSPTGKIFIDKARDILRDIDALKEIVRVEKDSLAGTYRLGIIPTIAPYLLPLFLYDFLGEHPHITIQVEELQSADLIEKLISGRLDLGILATPLNENQLREIPLYNEPFLLYANGNEAILHEKKLGPEQLSAEGLWLLSQGHCFRNQTENICGSIENPRSRKLQMEGGSIETLKSVVKSMGGYTLIPELSYQKPHDEPHIKRFDAPEPVREVSLVVHRSFAKKQLINNLRQAILQHLPPDFVKNENYVKVGWR